MIHFREGSTPLAVAATQPLPLSFSTALGDSLLLGFVVALSPAAAPQFRVSCDMKLQSVLLGGAILTKPCVSPQVFHGSMRLGGCPENGIASNRCVKRATFK